MERKGKNYKIKNRVKWKTNPELTIDFVFINGSSAELNKEVGY